MSEYFILSFNHPYIAFIIFMYIISSLKCSDLNRNCQNFCESQMIMLEYKANQSSCDHSCILKQCQNGCQIATDSNSSCEEVCKQIIPDLGSVSYCIKGCMQYKDILCSKMQSKIGKLPAPHVEPNSSTNESILIVWSSEPTLNLTYYLQLRTEPSPNNWIFYNTSSPILNDRLLVTGLKPFTQYRFRIGYKPTPCRSILFSEPSFIITTSASAPSSSPIITSLKTLKPNEITITWKPPKSPNGNIMAYIIYLYEYQTENKRIKEIPHQNSFTSINLTQISYNLTKPLTYTFSNLKPNTLYTVGISTLNRFGEGPQAQQNITTPFQNQTYPIEIIEPEPFLIMASNQKIFNQSSDIGEEKIILYYSQNESTNITSMDIHYKRKLIFFADSFGFLWSLSFSQLGKATRIYLKSKILKNLKVDKLSIDWINDQLYLLIDNVIIRSDLNGNINKKFGTKLVSKVCDIHVDPYNGFLYWSISDPVNGGLYRVSLFFSNDASKSIRLLKETNINVFTIDYNNRKIYFPENDTIFSASLEGDDIVDIRPNVATAYLRNVQSIVSFNNTFYWIIGTDLYKEEYHKDANIFYHNSYNIGNEKLTSLIIAHPNSQPIPKLIINRIPEAHFDPFTFLCIFLTSLLLSAMFVILRKVKKKHKMEKETLKDPEQRLNERNLISLPQLPSHPHEDNRLYLSSDLNFDGELNQIPYVTKEQIKFTKFLGSGAFGEVFEGLAHNLIPDKSPVKVAVKTLRKSSTEQEKADFIKEAKMMGLFKHPHILQLLGICLDPELNSILLELMEGGDLLSYLRSMRPVGNKLSLLTMNDLLSICVDVAKGCQYLEEMHFVHRDLAARNCLVSSYSKKNRVVKIGDFGLARDIYKNDYYRKEGEGLLPVRWMAPESLVDGVFTTQSDIWSFGVLLWEVMTLGQQPYPARNNQEVLNYVRSGGRPEKPPNCLEELFCLMTQCWNYEPNLRPTFVTCLRFLEDLRAKMFQTDTVITNIGNLSYYTNGFSSTDSDIKSGVINSANNFINYSLNNSKPESFQFNGYLNILNSRMCSSTDQDSYEVPIVGSLCELEGLLKQESQLNSTSDSILTQPKLYRSNGSPPPTYSQLFSNTHRITRSEDSYPLSSKV